jgi:ABC-2 type transport system ATP-binding protein
MIHIEHVRKAYGKLTAVDDVSLAIGRGERVGFVGANGSGKTTLLRALVGLLRVEGKISIDGHDVARTPERALGCVSYMPQIAPPIETPVRDLVRAHASLRGLRVDTVERLLALLGVELAAIARKRFRDLSGGTKQKVLAALSLATAAPVLICDEPTANLDAPARAAFFREVDRRDAAGVLILCSHRVEEIRHLVDRVIELRDGRVHADVRLGAAGLRLHRMIVTLTAGASDAEAFLRATGFASEGAHRFGARLSHSDRLDVLSLLLVRHRRVIVDLQLDDAGELELALAPPPLLRVVS